MTLTFAQKEVRKNRKKAREAEEKYKKTGTTDFLSKRDEFNDIANKLERNMKTDIQKKKVKKQTKISDEQAFSEAQAYNRKNKKKAEEESQKTSEKNEQMKKRREQLMKKLKDRETEQKEFIEKHRSQQEIQGKQMKEYREEKVKEYMKENPNASESEAQKAFVRNHNKMMEYLTAREEIIHKLMMLGMNRKEAEEKFKEIVKKGENED